MEPPIGATVESTCVVAPSRGLKVIAPWVTPLRRENCQGVRPRRDGPASPGAAALIGSGGRGQCWARAKPRWEAVAAAVRWRRPRLAGL